MIDVSVAKAHFYEAKLEFLRTKRNQRLQDFINVISCKILSRLRSVSASKGRSFLYSLIILSLNYTGALQTLALNL